MAVFSHRTVEYGRKGRMILVSHESGEVPLNLLGERVRGLDFSPRSQRNSFQELHREQLASLARLEPDVKSSLAAKAAAMGGGRLYYVPTTEAEMGEALAAVEKTLEERGHKLRPRAARSPLYVIEDMQGQPALAANAAWLESAMNLVARAKGRVKEAVPVPGTGLSRLIVDGPSAVEMARALEQMFPDAQLINLTREKILTRRPELEVSRPYLKSGRRGVELGLVHGNVSEMPQLANPERAHSLAPGAWVLRGTAQEQLGCVAEIKRVAEVPGFRVTYPVDVPEAKPSPVLASSAHLIADAIMGREAKVGPEALQKAANFKLKEKTLTPGQVECAAFALERPRAALAPDTGGGKTLMALVAAHTRAQETGGKTLVVCPPGLIPQWIRAIHRDIPLEGGQPPLEREPRWLRRLPKRIRREIDGMWGEVSKHFVFLPESALVSGVQVHRRKLRLDPEKRATTQAENALHALESVAKENVTAAIVDEGQGYRVAGGKFELLSAMVESGVKGALDVQSVVVCTATPLHRDAPDLYALFRLLGIPKFQKMSLAEFCRDYCQQKIVVGPDGGRALAAPQPPYGYGMLKEERIPEVADLLSDRMITRTKFQLAPEKSRPKEVAMPVAYEGSATLGIKLDNVVEGGALVPVSSRVASELSGEVSYVNKAMALAELKVGQTVQDTCQLLASLPPEQKVVVFSQFIGTAEQIAAELFAQGVPSHVLSSKRCLGPDRRELPGKQALIDDFVYGETPSRVLVATLGAGGTGIDGLHRVARNAVVNDFSVIPGVMSQAEGRIWRIEQEEVGASPEPVRIAYNICDDKFELHNLRHMLERMHEGEFIRRQGMLQGLDGPETVAAREMVQDRFEEDMLALVGQKPGPRLRDNTFLVAPQTADVGGAEEVAPEQGEEMLQPLAKHLLIQEVPGNTPQTLVL